MWEWLKPWLCREKKRLCSAAVLLALTGAVILGAGGKTQVCTGSLPSKEKTQIGAGISGLGEAAPTHTGILGSGEQTLTDAAAGENMEKDPVRQEREDGISGEPKKTEEKTGHWVPGSAGWKYRNPEGRLVRGQWLLDRGTYYYLNASGIMVCNTFFRIGGCRYHFAEDGTLSIGRFSVGEIEYYADEHGVPVSDSWVQEEGDRWFYCDEYGRILKNRLTPDSYFVGADGYMAVTPGTRCEAFTYSNGGRHRLSLNLGVSDIIWNYLKQKGWNNAAIAGVLGNFQQESGLNPDLIEQGRGDGYGLGQWSFERRSNLERYARATGKERSDLYAQLEFLCQEPGEQAFVRSYAKKNWLTPAAAAVEWGVGWERYNLSDRSMSRVRIPYAEAYYAHYVHGATSLVSGTRTEWKPERVLAFASAADAKPVVCASSEAGTGGPEDPAPLPAYMARFEGMQSDACYRSEGGSRARKVRRVTVFETENGSGPGYSGKQEPVGGEVQGEALLSADAGQEIKALPAAEGSTGIEANSSALGETASAVSAAAEEN